jgi:hypothetical protein
VFFFRKTQNNEFYFFKKILKASKKFNKLNFTNDFFFILSYDLSRVVSEDPTLVHLGTIWFPADCPLQYLQDFYSDHLFFASQKISFFILCFSKEKHKKRINEYLKL